MFFKAFFSTEKSIHKTSLHLEKHLQTDKFTQRSFYTQTRLHGETFTQNSFLRRSMQKFLHREILAQAKEIVCTQASFLHKEILTQKENFLHACVFHIEVLLILRCAIYDPLEGFKFQKWCFQKWRYKIWFFGVFNMLHMLSYDHQGVGGCINVLDEYFPCVTEHVHVAHAVVWSSGGWGCVLTSLTSTSLTLRNMYTVLSLQMEPEVLQLPTKDSRWPKSTTNKIFLLRLIMFEVVCGGKSYRTIVAGTQQMDGTWWTLMMEHWNTSQNGGLRRCSTKKSTSLPKRYTWAILGLQLDMASQRCLVAVCGFCVATSALALKRREEEKTGWVNVALIWPGWLKIIENHRFLYYVFGLWGAKSSHRAGETQIFTLESHACQSTWMPMLQTCFGDSCKYQKSVS